MSEVLNKKELQEELKKLNDTLVVEIKKKEKDRDIELITSLENQIKDLKTVINAMPDEVPIKKEVKKNTKPVSIKIVLGFWCAELNKSFFIGYYTPKNDKERKIIEKYNKLEKIPL